MTSSLANSGAAAKGAGGSDADTVALFTAALGDAVILKFEKSLPKLIMVNTKAAATLAYKNNFLCLSFICRSEGRGFNFRFEGSDFSIFNTGAGAVSTAGIEAGKGTMTGVGVVASVDTTIDVGTSDEAGEPQFLPQDNLLPLGPKLWQLFGPSVVLMRLNKMHCAHHSQFAEFAFSRDKHQALMPRCSGQAFSWPQ